MRVPRCSTSGQVMTIAATKNTPVTAGARARPAPRTRAYRGCRTAPRRGWWAGSGLPIDAGTAARRLDDWALVVMVGRVLGPPDDSQLHYGGGTRVAVTRDGCLSSAGLIDLRLPELQVDDPVLVICEVVRTLDEREIVRAEPP